MAITLKAADVVAVDSTAMMILEGLKQSKIITLKAAFDPGDVADQKWVVRENAAKLALDNAQTDYETASTDADKEAANASIKAASMMLTRIYDSYFGYFVRDNGKETILKGSMRDKVNTAVKAINANPPAWLGADVVYVNKVNLDEHSLHVERAPKGSKRTRVLRPQLASIEDNIDAMLEKVDESDSTPESTPESTPVE